MDRNSEAIAGIETVKANVQERYEWEKFTQNARVYRDYFVREGEIKARYLPMLMFSIIWAGGFFQAMLMWPAGDLTLGEVVTFMGLMGIFRFVTFISIFSFNLVQLGLASGGRILSLINTETDLDQNEAGLAQPMRGEVSFENVNFSYNGTPVLKNISFTALAGQTIAIVGQTGSGKTTLTRLINRIFDVDSGQVRVDGLDVLLLLGDGDTVRARGQGRLLGANEPGPHQQQGQPRQGEWGKPRPQGRDRPRPEGRDRRDEGNAEGVHIIESSLLSLPRGQGHSSCVPSRSRP